MNALDAVRKARKYLEGFDIDDAGREAELIIVHLIGKDRATLYRDNPRIPEDLISKIDEFLKRRSKREPLQYILGYTEFSGLKIKVGPGVLIPRPETELLLEEAIRTIAGKGKDLSVITQHLSLSILDLCTGSGCLALALARGFPDAQVFGTDISEVAIEYAKENAELNSIKNITFIRGSLFDPVEKLTFDLIISNPPYIRKDDIKSLQPEVKDWEPVESLNGGEDGLDYYRAIIPEARNYLKKGGCLVFELGIGQADAVKKMAEDTGLIDISLRKDYAGIDRILLAKLGVV